MSLHIKAINSIRVSRSDGAKLFVSFSHSVIHFAPVIRCLFRFLLFKTVIVHSRALVLTEVLKISEMSSCKMYMSTALGNELIFDSCST